MRYLQMLLISLTLTGCFYSSNISYSSKPKILIVDSVNNKPDFRFYYTLYREPFWFGIPLIFSFDLEKRKYRNLLSFNSDNKEFYKKDLRFNKFQLYDSDKLIFDCDSCIIFKQDTFSKNNYFSDYMIEINNKKDNNISIYLDFDLLNSDKSFQNYKINISTDKKVKRGLGLIFVGIIIPKQKNK
jgi:hypothetical protein